MHHQSIPQHNFTVDDATSIPFRYLPLELKDDHDVSVPHRHNYYEIFIFVQGGGTHEIDFEKYAIESNSLHFVSPGQVHKVQRTSSSFGWVIFFSRDFFMVAPQQEALLTNLPFIHPNGGQPVLKLSTDDLERLAPILKALEAESKSKGAFYEDVVRNYLGILLLECKRAPTPTSTLNSAALSITASTDPEAQLSRDFKLLLEKHFRTQHQVQDYASLLNTTPKSLNQALTKYTGTTASGHIFNRLTLEAKRLLRHSTLSVKEIAFFLNYEDPAHFSKFFKAQTGVSPAEFRSQ